MSSIKRSVQILELVARRGPLGVRAVAQQLQLPLGSVHRILLDLEEEAIIDRNAENEWELSYRLLEIVGAQLDRIELPRLARPFAERIAEQTRETVNVYALSALACVCVDKVRGNEGMQMDMRIGTRGAINAGGAGKAVLAYMSDTDRERVLALPLPSMTASTITDPDMLRAELVRIRRRGYSIDDQEVVVGVYCISVPVFDRTGRPVGALSITGPSVKKPGPDLQPLVTMLSEACGTISRKMGYAGHWPPVDAEPSVRQTA
jgi:DNA-binding IclR family transcriptional regulator